jgi:hypothetical protein
VPAHILEERHSTLDPVDLVAVHSVGLYLARIPVELENGIGIPLRSPDHTNHNLPPRSYLREPPQTYFRFGSNPDHKDPVVFVVHCYYSRSSPVELRGSELMPMGTVGRESEAGSQQILHQT